MRLMWELQMKDVGQQKKKLIIRRGAPDWTGGVSPRDWTPSELREMANYIEAHPESKLYSDGSGGETVLTD